MLFYSVIQKLALRLSERIITPTFVCNILKKNKTPVRTAGIYHVPSDASMQGEEFHGFSYTASC